MMPGFALSTQCRAPVEEVWKLLFDPARFPDWWVGVETVRTGSPGEFTQWPTGYPDFPMPHKLLVDQANEQVTVSCQVSDIEFTWQLAETGDGTSIHVTASLPESEAHRLDSQHQVIEESLHRLTALAEAGSLPVQAARTAPDTQDIQTGPANAAKLAGSPGHRSAGVRVPSTRYRGLPGLAVSVCWLRCWPDCPGVVHSGLCATVQCWLDSPAGITGGADEWAGADGSSCRGR